MFSERTNWSLQPNRLARALEERRRTGLPILDVTESNPTRCGFEYPEADLLAALADSGALVYEPDPRGALLARKAIAAYYTERGAAVSPEQIFLTTGTSEAYSYVFHLLADPGDNVLVPTPSYPLFDFLARLNDVELVHYALDYDHGWELNPGAVAERVNARSRAVLVVHPNNPTGSFVKPAELEFLVDCCRTQELALVVDEVFADYAFDATLPRVSTHAAESRVLTCTLSGLSKISALPQMKLAWIVVNGPEELRKAALERLEIVADSYLSVSTPLARALPRLLELRRQMQPQVLARTRANLAWLDEHLASSLPASRLATEGGWYTILKVPATRSDEDWAVELLKADGVYVHPGHFFDFASEGYLVLSLLAPEVIFQEATTRLLRHLEQESRRRA